MENTAAIRPDILGEPWVSRVLPLTASPDAPGADYAVLVHQREAGSGRHSRAVLHVPGFVDYFFHTEHAQAWLDAGVEYYALDQRCQGRASHGLERLEDIRDLTLREEDIRAALAVMRGHGHTHVTLLGHSTGGLQVAIFANRQRPDHAVDAIVLNSPWLDLAESEVLKLVATPLAHVLARVAPTFALSRLGAEYPRSLHVSYGGEWDFRTDWKVLETFPARAGFLHTVRNLQHEVFRGLSIEPPVLVCTSDRAGSAKKAEDLASADCVLDPADMHRLAHTMGRHVEVREFAGGRHDLALSVRPVREHYTEAVVAWSLAH